jgi:hypothetical protein
VYLHLFIYQNKHIHNNIFKLKNKKKYDVKYYKIHI